MKLMNCMKRLNARLRILLLHLKILLTIALRGIGSFFGHCGRLLRKGISFCRTKLSSLFRRRRGVYYVNGSDVLPPPLTKEEESAVIARLEDDERARQTLVEHNLRLVVYIAKRFENTGAGLEDLVSIGTIGLIKAINTFRAEKNIKLATYASRCIENEILMYIRKTAGSKAEVSIDEPLNTDWDGNELLLSDILSTDENVISFEIEQMEEKRAIRRAVAMLEPREREIIELRFGMGGKKELTQKEVADHLGISQSYISRLEKKIIARLKAEMEAEL